VLSTGGHCTHNGKDTDFDYACVPRRGECSAPLFCSMLTPPTQRTAPPIHTCDAFLHFFVRCAGWCVHVRMHPSIHPPTSSHLPYAPASLSLLPLSTSLSLTLIPPGQLTRLGWFSLCLALLEYSIHSLIRPSLRTCVSLGFLIRARRTTCQPRPRSTSQTDRQTAGQTATRQPTHLVRVSD